MGIICHQCQWSNKEINNNKKPLDKSENLVITLPKENIYNINFSELSEKGYPILEAKINNEKEVETKVSKINIDENNNKTDNLYKIRCKHSSTLDDNFNDTIQTELKVDNIKQENEEYYERKYSIKFDESENINNSNEEIKNKEKPRIKFERRKRKSKSLIQDSLALKNLLFIKMNILLPQDILVQKQIGNPGDKYLAGKKIGKGTFGSVYECQNKIFSNKVAMKIILKNYLMNNSLIKNEIDILKKLSHPNIVRIYEFYESNNCFYIINEFCPCGELYNFINNSKLDEEQLSVIFYQVFSGLKYLHENNILHGDLKPENILISKKEKDLLDNKEYFWIKIVDFGTAKIFEKDKNENSIVGSPYYIAPEVLNSNYNEKCDTWSVGVILYMFLVGKPPFNGQNSAEIVNSIMTKNYDDKNPKLLTHSEEVRDLIKHLIEKDTSKRLSSKEALNHIWFKKYDGRKIFKNFHKNEISIYIDNLFNYTLSSKIQQLVIAFLVHNLPQTKSTYNILKLYRYFNKAGDCKLTKDELINGLYEFRDKEEVNKKIDTLILLLDCNKNGIIEYEEFLRACIDKKELLNDKYLNYAFKFLDTENKNLLSEEQINSAFFSNEKKMFEYSLTKDLIQLDEDGDEMINFEEFKTLMLKTMT